MDNENRNFDDNPMQFDLMSFDEYQQDPVQTEVQFNDHQQIPEATEVSFGDYQYDPQEPPAYFVQEQANPEKQKSASEKMKELWNSKGKPMVSAVCNQARRAGYAVASLVGGLDGKKKKMALGIGAGVVALLLLVVILSATVLRSPAAKVGIALGNTAEAFSDVLDLWNVSDLSKVFSQKSYSLDADIRVNSLEDDDELSGIGVRVMMDTNLKKKKIGVQMVPHIGSADLMQIMVAAEDEYVYFYSPELMPDIYGVSTVTMMEDLDNLGLDVGDAEDISFNLFEVLEMANQAYENAEENKKVLQAALKELVASISVEKGKKQNVRVNGTTLNCASYVAVIPQDAMENYLEIVEEIMTATDSQETMEEILESMNLPRSIIRSILSEMPASTLDFDAYYDLLDRIGDVELKLFIHRNKIVSVKFDQEVYGDDWKCQLFIGGGDRYTDNISLKLDDGYTEIIIKSSGDHTAKEGIFTDKTTIEVDGDKVTIQVKYDPKAKADNLSIKLKSDWEEYKISGTYLVSGSALQLDLDEIVCEYVNFDKEKYDISVNLWLGKYSKRVDVSDARMLSDMTEDDLEEIIEDIEEMATGWALGLVEEFPELMYMF